MVKLISFVWIVTGLWPVSSSHFSGHSVDVLQPHWSCKWTKYPGEDLRADLINTMNWQIFHFQLFFPTPLSTSPTTPTLFCREHGGMKILSQMEIIGGGKEPCPVCLINSHNNRWIVPEGWWHKTLSCNIWAVISKHLLSFVSDAVMWWIELNNARAYTLCIGIQ